MYTSFNIQRFRCFEHLDIKALTQFNLITGYNNSGKSTLLEALWMHSGPDRPDLPLRMLQFRGISAPDTERLAHDLFFNFNIYAPIRLTAHGDWGRQPRVLKVEALSEPKPISISPQANGRQVPDHQEVGTTPVSNTSLILSYLDEKGHSFNSKARWTPTNHDKFGNYEMDLSIESDHAPPRPNNILLAPLNRRTPLENSIQLDRVIQDGHEAAVVECLKAIDPRIRHIRTMASPKTMIYTDVGLSRLIPLGLLGDGVNRLLSLSLAMFEAQDGMLLVDEIENGLHHKVLEQVWQQLQTLADLCNVQIIATTHSGECLTAAMRAFHGSDPENLSVHRLDMRKGKPFAATSLADDWEYVLQIEGEMR